MTFKILFTHTTMDQQIKAIEEKMAQLIKDREELRAETDELIKKYIEFNKQQDELQTRENLCEEKETALEVKRAELIEFESSLYAWVVILNNAFEINVFRKGS